MIMGNVLCSILLKADNRFFWNKAMLEEIIVLSKSVR